MAVSALTRISDPGVRDALRLRSAILGKPLIGPMSVNIHITSACNYHCEFCWYFSPFVKDQPKKKILDWDVLEGVLEDCQEIGVDEINLEGGEVTLYPYWKDAFRKVKELGMRLVSYNHLDCSADYVPVLSLAELLKVNFSAVTEDSFKRVHGPKASITRVLRNVDRLLAIRQKRGKPQILLSFVIYNHNYRELPGFLEMARQRKVDQVVIRFFKPTEEMRELFFSKEDMDALRRIVDVVLQTPYEFRHDLKHLQRVLAEGKMFDNVDSMAHSPMHNDRLLFYDATGGSIKCNVGWFYANIDEKGRVVAPCDNVGVCVAGNVNERRFKDIWFDNDFLHDTLREASGGIHTCNSKWKECRYCSYVPMNKLLEQRINQARSEQRHDP
jgi:MoaA/NifB/PqqE/SkfB family radical SAM enzyme